MKQNPHIPGSPDEFIKRNMGLAHDVGFKFFLSAQKDERIKFDQEDFNSIAYIGLIKAYNRFDPTKFRNRDGEAVQFSSFAVPTIRGEIMRQTRDHGHLIRKHRSLGVAETDSLDRPIWNYSTTPITLAEKITGVEVINERSVVAKQFLSLMGPRIRRIYELRCKDLSQMEVAKIMRTSQVSVGRIEKYMLECAEKWGRGEDFKVRYSDGLKVG